MQTQSEGYTDTSLKTNSSSQCAAAKYLFSTLAVTGKVVTFVAYVYSYCNHGLLLLQFFY